MEQTNEHTRRSSNAAPAETSTAATLAICSGAWLIPGLGHILLGRWVRGLIFAAAVLAMFIMGLAMHGKLYDLAFEEPLQLFAFIANVGVCLPYMIAEHFDLGAGLTIARSYDYGTVYLWVCGLLNFLVVIDAFDIAKGRKP